VTRIFGGAVSRSSILPIARFSRRLRLFYVSPSEEGARGTIRYCVSRAVAQIRDNPLNSCGDNARRSFVSGRVRLGPRTRAVLFVQTYPAPSCSYLGLRRVKPARQTRLEVGRRTAGLFRGRLFLKSRAKEIASAFRFTNRKPTARPNVKS